MIEKKSNMLKFAKEWNKVNDQKLEKLGKLLDRNSSNLHLHSKK